MTIKLVSLAALALASACAGSQARPADSAAAPAPAIRDTVAGAQGGPGPAATVSAQRRFRADRNTVTREEIDQNGQASATLYDFVIARHNEWIRSTGGGRLTQSAGSMNAATTTRADESASRAVAVTVYVDGIRFGTNPEALRNIPLATVQLARRLGPSEAQMKYGQDNDAGTIEVWTSLERVR